MVVAESVVEIKVQAKKRRYLPVYQSEGAAGADLLAAIESDIIIQPRARALIPTGLFLEIPKGYEVQVRSRSGLAIKHGVAVLNSPGTIDSDYRGEVGVILINHGEKPFHVLPEMRIAQMVVAPVSQAQLFVVSTVTETERGAGGFGHTGM